MATPRAECPRCLRPVSVCYCAALPRLETATRVVILQHPRERTVAIGTARMAALCLPQAQLHVGVRWSESAPLARALADPARPPILLYPGPNARDILRDPPAGPVTLVVVDGTWSQARTVVRDNPVLQALPRYAFAAPELSQYRIRREPDDEYVSTIEALMHVLGALEGDPVRFRALLDPLRAMVDAQIECQARSPRRGVPRHPRPLRPPRRIVPAELKTRFDDLVCVVGEANAWPYRADQPSHDDGIVHWVAHRVGAGDSFDVITPPVGPLSPSTCMHTELDEARLWAGVPRAELVDRFDQFIRSTDIICSWGHYAPELFQAGGGRLPAARLDLRAAAQRLTNRKIGSLESYAAELGPIPAPLTAGRAGRRLAMLAHVLRSWRALPSDD